MPGIGSVRQQPGMALRDVEHNRAGLEQAEITVLVGRDLPERMQREMSGFFHRGERNQADLVGLAHFLQRPANARIPRQALAAIGRPFKGGDGGGHGKARGACTTPSRKTTALRMMFRIGHSPYLV